MLKTKKIKVGQSYLEAFLILLLGKKLIVIKGQHGYIMCGYLNLKAANKFGDVAIKVAGVNSLEDVLKTTVFACSRRAKKLGIYPGQKISRVLKIIA